MPRFSKTERENIREDLLTEGELLFVTFGLKKVTVDDLTRAVSIAKGSFYAFYASKEHLYMDILNRCQSDMLKSLREHLKKNSGKPPRQLMKSAVNYILKLTSRYPLLSRTDSETVAILARRLPEEIIDSYARQDSLGVTMLTEFGVEFACSREAAVKAVQCLSAAAGAMEKEDEKLREEVQALLIEGVVDKMVANT